MVEPIISKELLALHVMSGGRYQKRQIRAYQKRSMDACRRLEKEGMA